jgi:hypothetical protein
MPVLTHLWCAFPPAVQVSRQYFLASTLSGFVSFVHEVLPDACIFMRISTVGRSPCGCAYLHLLSSSSIPKREKTHGISGND